MVDFPSGVAATDPTFLVGSNTTAAAKLAINAQGRSLVSAVDAAAERVVMQACADSSLEYASFEPFLNAVTGLSQGIASTVTGGTNTNLNVTGRQGVVKMAVGTAATADRTCNIGSHLASTISLGNGIMEFTVEGAPTVALASGGVTGNTILGFHDAPNSNVEPTDGCYFRSVNGGNWFAVCRSNNVETAVDTGILPVLDTYLFHRVVVNANATSVDFKTFNASGTQIDTRTITTDIPTGAGRQVGHGVRIVRITATGTDHSYALDSMFLRFVFNAALPF
jgi:hypothetical protein